MAWAASMTDATRRQYTVTIHCRATDGLEETGPTPGRHIVYQVSGDASEIVELLQREAVPLFQFRSATADDAHDPNT